MPPQATIEAGARDGRVQELAQRALCAIGSSTMASARRSSSGSSSAWRRTTAKASCAGVSVQRENDPPDRFLLRVTLQPVRRVAAVVHAVALAPFVDPLRIRRENESLDRFLVRLIPGAVRKRDPRVIAALIDRPDLRSPLCLNQWRMNGSPSSLACEDGSAWSRPVPKLPQNRSCHEQRRSPRTYVIVRDGTPTQRPFAARLDGWPPCCRRHKGGEYSCLNCGSGGCAACHHSLNATAAPKRFGAAAIRA